MSWISSFFIAALTGAFSLVAGGFVAAGCVGWYRISGFEGKSGYFMAAIAILSGFAGVVLGFGVSRLLVVSGAEGFFKGLGLCWGTVLVIAGVSALICWALADVPPRIGGQFLDLEVEIRLPVGETNSPANLPGEASLTLGSVINHVQRKSEEGELRVQAARLEQGRWIVPGSVRVFTMRGRRAIEARVGDKSLGGFLVPLPARPGKKFEQWSEWEPRPRHGSPPWPDTNPSYR